ncbi:unnamed protein product, partial [Didymodactylos carnosus]
MVLLFDELPNEIILEIFDLLNTSDLIRSFYKLNNRIDKLISETTINLINIDLTNFSKYQFNYCCEQIVSTNYNQVRSLTLSNICTFGQILVFTSMYDIGQFSNLQSITLIEPEVRQYLVIIQKSPKITYLSVTLNEVDEIEEKDVGTIILSNPLPPLLKTLKLFYNGQISIGKLGTHFNLQYLTIIADCYFTDLFHIFDCFPCINYLEIELIGIQSDIDTYLFTINSSTMPEHLQTLKINNLSVNFRAIELLLMRLNQLKELSYRSIASENNNDAHTDSNRWQSILSSYPLLEKFHMDIIIEDNSLDICELSSSFQTQYWLYHRWTIICESSVNNSNVYHLYTIPYSNSIFSTSSENLQSTSVLDVSNAYDTINYLNLNLTSHWPFITRKYLNVHTLELVNTSTNLLSSSSVISYLNKTIIFSNLKHLIIQND